MSSKRNIREANLQDILLSKFIPVESEDKEFSTWELQGTMEEKTLLETYAALEGRSSFPEIKFNVPFMEFGRFVVVFDDVLHFNRYRAKTLRSSFYENQSSFPLVKFRSYCRKYESECLKSGAANPAWTNNEAERHFGPSEQNGDLGLSGSAGWKLTAFKDFAVDLIAKKRKIRLLRISTWDDLMFQKKLVKFHELLMSPDKAKAEEILKFVERKVVGLYVDDF